MRIVASHGLSNLFTPKKNMIGQGKPLIFFSQNFPPSCLLDRRVVCGSELYASEILANFDNVRKN
eukprot:1390842-Amorphochlora_amoeboformis.AAC.1